MQQLREIVRNIYRQKFSSKYLINRICQKVSQKLHVLSRIAKYVCYSDLFTIQLLSNKIKSINCSILEFSDAVVTKILLFGDNTLSDSCNTSF